MQNWADVDVSSDAVSEECLPGEYFLSIIYVCVCESVDCCIVLDGNGFVRVSNSSSGSN